MELEHVLQRTVSDILSVEGNVHQTLSLNYRTAVILQDNSVLDSPLYVIILVLLFVVSVTYVVSVGIKCRVNSLITGLN